MNRYFHNPSNYDAHDVALGLVGGIVSVLANTDEKYIVFTKHLTFPGVRRENFGTLR